MDVETFKNSLPDHQPPLGTSPALQAMWYDARGDWHQAHEQAQGQNDDAGAWVHAYLHRKEGDAANAAYWYRRAQQPFSALSTEEEWATLVAAFLQQSTR